MPSLRHQVVDIIKSWKGMKESDGSFKPIVDIYNSIQPLPAGYRLKYTDDWGPGTISAVYQQAGIAGVFPCECSYPRMISIAKEMKIWVEDDKYLPRIADVCMFSNEDVLFGDNRKVPDQGGIVVSVNKKARTFVVMIGNINREVNQQTFSVDSQYIRGYITPIFIDDEPKKKLEPPTETIVTETPPPPDATTPIVKGTGILSKVAAGTALQLVRTPIYASPNTAVNSGSKTGKYYIWSVETVNGRIRITNAKEYVGVKGQVTGWINVANALETVADVPPSTSSANVPSYQVNAVYIVQVDELQVREGPGTNYKELTYADLTPNARKYDRHKNGCLCLGAKVTCLEVQVTGINVWMRIPSGWVKAYYNKQYFVK